MFNRCAVMQPMHKIKKAALLIPGQLNMLNAHV